LADQRVTLAALGLEVGFRSGERVHTENSYKFRPAHIEGLLRSAGWELRRQWRDPRNWFTLCLARVPDGHSPVRAGHSPTPGH